jgi:opacity protein-like surface antigen
LLSFGPGRRACLCSALLDLTLAVCLLFAVQRAQAQLPSPSPSPSQAQTEAQTQVQAQAQVQVSIHDLAGFDGYRQLAENAPAPGWPADTAFSAQPPIHLLAPESTSPPASGQESAQEPVREKQPVESELIIEGEGSVGHFHIFADSWWSELYTGGIEYDRHSWNYFLKSQMDWVAELLPLTILRQPSDTDAFGDALSQARYINPGVGIFPIGLRMKWRYDKGWQPYFIAKGGMLFFAHKALSKDAARENFGLQIGLGMQRRLTKRVDMRAGFEYFHFSDAFVVPSNPGLDSMAYDGGIVYRLGK